MNQKSPWMVRFVGSLYHFEKQHCFIEYNSDDLKDAVFALLLATVPDVAQAVSDALSGTARSRAVTTRKDDVIAGSM